MLTTTSDDSLVPEALDQYEYETSTPEPLLPAGVNFGQASPQQGSRDLACDDLSRDRPLMLGLLIEHVLKVEAETISVDLGHDGDAARSVINALTDLGVDVDRDIYGCRMWEPVAVVAGRCVEVGWFYADYDNGVDRRVRVRPLPTFDLIDRNGSLMPASSS